MGIIPYEVLQQYEIIKTLIVNVRTDDKWKILLRIDANYLTLEAGIQRDILTGERPKYITAHTWLMRVWKSLENLQGTLLINNLMNIQLHHEGDAFIMDLPHQCTIQMLKNVNHCRMYVQAITVSDIVNYKGDCIISEFLNGQWKCNSQFTWPNQIQPSKVAWQQWRRFLRYALHANTSPKEKVLLDPLGKWHVSKRHIRYPMMWDPSSNAVYKSIGVQ